MKNDIQVNSFIQASLSIVVSLTPLILAPWYYDYFGYPKIIFIYFVIATVIIYWTLVEKEKSNILKEVGRDNKILLCYFLLLTVSTILSVDLETSLWGAFRRDEGYFTLIAYIVLFLLANIYYSPTINNLKIFTLTATIISIYGILQTFNIDPIPRDYFHENWTNIAFSTIGNPNFLGSMLVLFLPISVYIFFTKRSSLYLLTSCIIYYCLLATMTRGAWLGAFVSFIVLVVIFLKIKGFLREIIVISAAFLFASILFAIVDNRDLIARLFSISYDFGSLITQSEGYENGGAGRIMIWQRVIELISLKPFIGYGPDTLAVVFPSENMDTINNFFGNQYIDKAHNEYLQIAFASGIPALIFYLTFVFKIVINSSKYIFSNQMLIPIYCSVVGYLVQAFFNISIVAVAYIFWIFLGVLAYANNKYAIKVK